MFIRKVNLKIKSLNNNLFCRSIYNENGENYGENFKGENSYSEFSLFSRTHHFKLNVILHNFSLVKREI